MADKYPAPYPEWKRFEGAKIMSDPYPIDNEAEWMKKMRKIWGIVSFLILYGVAVAFGTFMLIDHYRNVLFKCVYFPGANL